jgi:hypothetical protein
MSSPFMAASLQKTRKEAVRKYREKRKRRGPGEPDTREKGNGER